MSFNTILKRILPSLKQIIFKLHRKSAVIDTDDLYQESLIYLWLNIKNGILADKTDSYILQGCYFHLQNYIRTKSDKFESVSLDNFFPGDDSLLLEEIIPDRQSGTDSTGITGLLPSGKLTEREKQVLELVKKGMTVREIGKHLGISHVRVVKLKQKLSKKL